MITELKKQLAELKARIDAFKRKPLSGSYATGYGRVEEPCKHPVALDHEI